ncbi:MAG: hypothetical protein IJC15_01715 [Clostridia bacterium]|nr:hypothetical protein [Clostridia bacterium]
MLAPSHNEVVAAVVVGNPAPCLVGGDAPVGEVGPIVGQEQLIHPPHRQGWVGGDVGAVNECDDPEQLQGGAEVGRPLVGSAAKCTCRFVQSRRLGRVGIAVHVGRNGVVDFKDGQQKVPPFGVILLGQ